MTDRKMESVLGNLLRFGVLSAGAVVLAGGAWYLSVQGTAPVAFGKFQPRKGVMPWNGSLALIQWGLLILIATPVARVVFSVVAFTLEKDRIYICVSLIVLAILVYSLGGW